jgi:hypothetical protein
MAILSFSFCSNPDIAETFMMPHASYPAASAAFLIFLRTPVRNDGVTV